MQNPHIKYRPDIDGLRAIAVVSVVLFHLFPMAFRGGFIGVDVFFVISGYLISTIIIQTVNRSNFSILDFYSRRIKRIFPALILVFITCFIIGWNFLHADEFKMLGKHIASGVFFVSNYAFLFESGYFDHAAESKPLLHLWSLAIEEQFYIFWPLLLTFMVKRKKPYLIYLICALSFTYCLYLSYTAPSSAFFSPFSRFWELIIGGILAVNTFNDKISSPLSPNKKSLIGLLMLLLGFVIINKSKSFPGYWSILPTVGTYLLISAGPSALINKKFLSHKFLVSIGLISYPLYLWHWIFISFFNILFLDRNILDISIIAMAPILLAWLTYYFIERPIRLQKLGHVFSLTLLTIVMLLGGGGMIVYFNDGFEGYGPRTSKKALFANHYSNNPPDYQYFKREKITEKYNEKCNFYDLDNYFKGSATNVPRSIIDPSCHLRDENKKHTILLWGDSHGSHLYHGLSQTLDKNYQILQITSSGCRPNLEGQESQTDYCEQSNWFALKVIKEVKPKTVIIAQISDHSFKDMEKIQSSLYSLGVRKILFTGPSPRWETPIPKVILKLWNDVPEKTFLGVSKSLLKRNQNLKDESQKYPHIRYIDIISNFCDVAGCLLYVNGDMLNGVVSYDDYGHLTPLASIHLVKNKILPLIVN